MKRIVTSWLVACVGTLLLLLLVPHASTFSVIQENGATDESVSLYQSYVEAISTQNISLWFQPSTGNGCQVGVHEMGTQGNVAHVLAFHCSYFEQKDGVLFTLAGVKRLLFLSFYRIHHFYSLRKLII